MAHDHPPHRARASHSHGDHGHSHPSADGAGADRRLRWALLITASFMLVEVIGGIWSGSLALLADAGHMLTDALALALALWARHQTRRPADARRTYGYHRMPVLAAFVNGMALIGIVLWIVIEAARRLLMPPQVEGELMLGVAVAGLAVNIIAFVILGGHHVHGGGEDDHDHRHKDLNLRGATLHVLGDLLGSVAAIVAAIVIIYTGWMAVDPLLSVLVALLILRSAWGLVAESGHVLLEGTPAGFDERAFARALTRQVPGVVDVHHVHHWMLTPQRSVMTLHAVIDATADADALLQQIQHYSARDHGVAHVTVQIERAGCADEAAPHRCE